MVYRGRFSIDRGYLYNCWTLSCVFYWKLKFRFFLKVQHQHNKWINFIKSYLKIIFAFITELDFDRKISKRDGFTILLSHDLYIRNQGVRPSSSSYQQLPISTTGTINVTFLFMFLCCQSSILPLPHFSKIEDKLIFDSRLLGMIYLSCCATARQGGQASSAFNRGTKQQLRAHMIHTNMLK